MADAGSFALARGGAEQLCCGAFAVGSACRWQAAVLARTARGDAAAPLSLLALEKVSAMPARLLSIPAVAAALDVDRRTVYRFIAAGDLPVVDLRTGTGRSRVRVPAAGLDEFISRRVVAPPAVRR